MSTISGMTSMSSLAGQPPETNGETITVPPACEEEPEVMIKTELPGVKIKPEKTPVPPKRFRMDDRDEDSEEETSSEEYPQVTIMERDMRVMFIAMATKPKTKEEADT